MSDLIDRQALLKQIGIDSDGEPGYYGDTWKFIDTIKNMPNVHDLPKDTDTISRQAAITAIQNAYCDTEGGEDKCAVWKNVGLTNALHIMQDLPSAQPEIIRCKDCEHWRQQTNYQGTLLSFGFCESDDMWRSLYGETYEVSHIDTDDDFYCGYAERRQDD